MNKTVPPAWHKSYFNAKTFPQGHAFPRTQYLAMAGKGDPSGSEFAENVQTLYTTVYTLKFMLKKVKIDFSVSKLEALWWFDAERYKVTSMAEAPIAIPRKEWFYRLLMMIPDNISESEIHHAIDAVVQKKKSERARAVTLYHLEEKKCVQILHVGPFDKEPETLQKLQAFMHENKLRQSGLHHEIYLSDFRKTPPEKLKTILREPVV